jgi:hypothetical protein
MRSLIRRIDALASSRKTDINERQRERLDHLLASKQALDRPFSHDRIIESAQKNPNDRFRL